MTLKQIIKSKNITKLRQITKTTPIVTFANQVNQLTRNERTFLLRVLDIKQASKLFSYLESKIQAKIISEFTDWEQKKLLQSIYADDIVDLIEEMPPNISKRILKNTPKERRGDVNKILKYDDDQSGSIMSTDMVELKKTWTASQALKFIKKESEHIKKTLIYFVVDRNEKLLGAIKLNDLAFLEPNTKIEEIIYPIKSIETTMDLDTAVKIFAKHDENILPVINTHKHLVGMITSDDVIDTIQEETTEDIHKMAGIEGINISYFKTSIAELFKSRIIWLLLLLISSTLSQIVLESLIKVLDSTIKTTTTASITTTLTTIIVAIVPVISGAAGNAGSQASTMVTRGLALGEVEKHKFWQVFRREATIGIMVGSILATINFIRLIIYYSITGDLLNKTIVDSNSYPFIWISFSASLALFVVILFAKIIGGLLPIFAYWLKIDPASMTAPLLTTLIDALSILIFFGISIGILLLVVS